MGSLRAQSRRSRRSEKSLAIKPEYGASRFYSLVVKRDLFGTVRLVRNWGQIDTIGQELVEIHADEAAGGPGAGGYRDL